MDEGITITDGRLDQHYSLHLQYPVWEGMRRMIERRLRAAAKALPEVPGGRWDARLDWDDSSPADGYMVKVHLYMQRNAPGAPQAGEAIEIFRKAAEKLTGTMLVGGDGIDLAQVVGSDIRILQDRLYRLEDEVRELRMKVGDE